MKKRVYQSLYQVLLVLSNRFDSRRISHWKMLVGTSLLLLAGSCQTNKKNDKENGDAKADTLATDSLAADGSRIPEGVLCYTPAVIKEDTVAYTAPDIPVVDCYEIIAPTCYDPVSVDTLIQIPPDSDNVYAMVDSMPEYPGGTQALVNFITENVSYPANCAEDVQGRVIIRLVIERDGTVSHPEVMRSLHPDFDKEAIAVINKLPRWKPGVFKGEAVRVYYTIPVLFRIQ